MFVGEYNHSLDSKARLIVPSKFREELGAHFIITKGLDKCLVMYTAEDWAVLNEKVKQLPMTDEGSRRFIRFIFGGASENECDAQGRVILPQNLREYAGIQKEVVTLGVSNRVEIWSKENWNAYTNDTVDQELAEHMAQLGI